MKVIYEDSVIKRIQRAVFEADLANRRIGYIELTVREANQLSDYVRSKLWVQDGTEFQYYTSRDSGKTVGHFYGAEIRVELTT
jgi:hypothetical protein